jgi:protein-S-isoprenylcysteine O-methyltransferase Ste14
MHMEKLLGFLTPALVYFLVFILNAIMPGRWVSGYVAGKNSGKKLRYRLNGILVLFTVLFTWTILCNAGIIPWEWFYTQRWYAMVGAAVFGLIFSLAAVLPHPPLKKSLIADFFFGRSENPRLWGGRIDTKMWLYLAGAIMLELNIMGVVVHSMILSGDQPNYGLLFSAALLTFFVVDYLIFEEIHLYTYDFVAEKVGFKLGWGCTAFYPYFYAIPLWVAADSTNVKVSVWLLIFYALIFLASWSLSRGANMQKFFFKKNPKMAFLGIVPEIITDEKKSLLVNGFWGLSRHINYLGEIGMAISIILCTGQSLLSWGWLYPVYYIALLFPRQAEDNKRCRQKYGKLWDQYEKKVPNRIIPYIY